MRYQPTKQILEFFQVSIYFLGLTDITLIIMFRVTSIVSQLAFLVSSYIHLCSFSNMPITVQLLVSKQSERNTDRPVLISAGAKHMYRGTECHNSSTCCHVYIMCAELGSSHY